jgi:hypothetical protein
MSAHQLQQMMRPFLKAIQTQKEPISFYAGWAKAIEQTLEADPVTNQGDAR